MAKITISIPDEVYEKVESLKKYFSSNTVSGIVALGIETLNWLKLQSDNDFISVSLKQGETGNMIREIPLIKLHRDSKLVMKLMNCQLEEKENSNKLTESIEKTE